jgi:serine/threonine protein kinase
VQLIRSDVSDLDAACERLAAAAQSRAAERGYSAEQFCFQLVRIDRLAEPRTEAQGTPRPASGLPIPPELDVGSRLDGFEVRAVLERTPQTRLYHVRDERSGREMALKAPSPELSRRNAYLEHFLLQQWVLERVRSPFLVEAQRRSRPPRHLYYLFTLPPGETLSDWVKRYPRATLAQRLDIARQLTKAVMALHRHDVLHQRIHPDSVLLDPHGQVLLSDLSACHRRDGDGYRSARELARQIGLNEHSAPEYALDTDVGRRSDQYALASTIYWLLTEQLPYTTAPHRLRSHTGLERMRYRSARLHNPQVSVALDEALRRALDPQRALRFRRLGEFRRALREPRPTATAGPAWREPASLWQGVAGILLLLLVLSWLLK